MSSDSACFSLALLLSFLLVIIYFSLFLYFLRFWLMLTLGTRQLNSFKLSLLYNFLCPSHLYLAEVSLSFYLFYVHFSLYSPHPFACDHQVFYFIFIIFTLDSIVDYYATFTSFYTLHLSLHHISHKHPTLHFVPHLTNTLPLCILHSLVSQRTPSFPVPLQYPSLHLPPHSPPFPHFHQYPHIHTAILHHRPTFYYLHACHFSLPLHAATDKRAKLQ